MFIRPVVKDHLSWETIKSRNRFIQVSLYIIIVITIQWHPLCWPSQYYIHLPSGIFSIVILPFLPSCLCLKLWSVIRMYCICLRIYNFNNGLNMDNTRMLVTFGICFKQHFDTRYLRFYNPSPPRMFLSLDLLWEYQIQHGANGPLYVTSSHSTWIFCRGVSGFATDCPCDVWCRGLTTCLLHVGPPFGNRILNNIWAVGLT